MAYASSLDVVGCFGNSVMDAAILLEAVAGADKNDSTCSPQDVPGYTTNLLPVDGLGSKPLAGLKIGIISETVGDGVDEDVLLAVRQAVAHLESLGASIREVAMPNFSQGLPAYYVLATAEASSNLARYDGVRYGPRANGEEVMSMYGNSRGQGFGSEVKRRILMGTYALSAGYYDAFYKKAQQVRTVIQQDFKSALQQVDLLISPVAPSAAYKIGEKVNDTLSMYVGDLMTVNVNLAGLPALVVPCGLAKGGTCGLPVGLQMIGPAFKEESLLRLGHVFEQTLPLSFNAPTLEA
jgi:aspartyl-tRNA(Asn)/glutamyl-tRNA(Gln) amidotransferase subunit A